MQIPVVTLNDGTSTGIYRFRDDGSLRAATINPSLPTGDGFGSFYGRAEVPVLDLGRLSPVVIGRDGLIEPVCPPPPRDGLSLTILNATCALAYDWDGPEVFVWRGGDWSRLEVPQGVVVKAGWMAAGGDLHVAGLEGTRPVAYNTIDWQSVDVPWRSRTWSFRRGDGPPMLTARQEERGPLILQDEGYWVHHVNTVYWFADGRWHRKYLGDRFPVQLYDPDRRLPAVLASDGRLFGSDGTDVGSRSRLRVPRGIRGRRRVEWSYVCVAGGELTALLTGWGDDAAQYVVTGPAAGELEVIAEFGGHGAPSYMTMRLLDEDLLEWEA